MKIGIFGGSFNPPHKMHESIASQLIERKIIDKVIFVPTSNFYPKAGLISDEERLSMLKLLIKDKKEYDVSDYEFGRLTYTHQTLEYFKNENCSVIAMDLNKGFNEKQIVSAINYLMRAKIEKDLKNAVEAIKKNHPYEEVCINVIPLIKV